VNLLVTARESCKDRRTPEKNVFLGRKRDRTEDPLVPRRQKGA